MKSLFFESQEFFKAGNRASKIPTPKTYHRFTAMGFALTGICGEDEEVKYEDREIGVEKYESIVEKAPEESGKTGEEMEVLGGGIKGFIRGGCSQIEWDEK